MGEGEKVTRIYTIIQKLIHFNLFFQKEREREGGERMREGINRGRKQRSRVRGKKGEGKEKEGRKKRRKGGTKERGKLNFFPVALKSSQ